jgi:hypothetical protein
MSSLETYAKMTKILHRHWLKEAIFTMGRHKDKVAFLGHVLKVSGQTLRLEFWVRKAIGFLK